MNKEQQEVMDNLAKLFTQRFEEMGIHPDDWLEKESKLHNRHHDLPLEGFNNLPKHIYDKIIEEADKSRGQITQKMKDTIEQYYKDIQTKIS